MSYQIPQDTEILSTEILTNAWRSYLEKKIRDKTQLDVYTRRGSKFLGNNSIPTRLEQEFADWLWKQGAHIIRRQGKPMLQFVDAECATLFALKWHVKRVN